MRTMNLPYSFGIAALLLGCFFVVTFTACENRMEEVDNLNKKQIAIEETNKVESYLSQAGKVKAKLTSPYMLRYQAPDSPCIDVQRAMQLECYADSNQGES